MREIPNERVLSASEVDQAKALVFVLLVLVTDTSLDMGVFILTRTIRSVDNKSGKSET